MVLELVNFGPLDVYLQRESQTVKTVDLIEAATSLANAVFHLVSDLFFLEIFFTKERIKTYCQLENSFFTIFLFYSKELTHFFYLL